MSKNSTKNSTSNATIAATALEAPLELQAAQPEAVTTIESFKEAPEAVAPITSLEDQLKEAKAEIWVLVGEVETLQEKLDNQSIRFPDGRRVKVAMIQKSIDRMGSLIGRVKKSLEGVDSLQSQKTKIVDIWSATNEIEAAKFLKMAKDLGHVDKQDADKLTVMMKYTQASNALLDA